MLSPREEVSPNPSTVLVRLAKVSHTNKAPAFDCPPILSAGSVVCMLLPDGAYCIKRYFGCQLLKKNNWIYM